MKATAPKGTSISPDLVIDGVIKLLIVLPEPCRYRNMRRLIGDRLLFTFSPHHNPDSKNKGLPPNLEVTLEGTWSKEVEILKDAISVVEAVEGGQDMAFRAVLIERKLFNDACQRPLPLEMTEVP